MKKASAALPLVLGVLALGVFGSVVFLVTHPLRTDPRAPATVVRDGDKVRVTYYGQVEADQPHGSPERPRRYMLRLAAGASVQLKSSTVDLRKYDGQHVQLAGTLPKESRDSYELVYVQNVQVVQK